MGHLSFTLFKCIILIDNLDTFFVFFFYLIVLFCCALFAYRAGVPSTAEILLTHRKEFFMKTFNKSCELVFQATCHKGLRYCGFLL